MPTPMVRQTLIPTLVLLFVPGVLAEVGSGNIPLAALWHPAILLFLPVAYGLPLLVIREIAVRRGFGALRVLLLGLAYGLYNEGILARTLERTTLLPVATFGNYGVWQGVSVPWALFIVSWHACFAVLFPLAVIHALFPMVRGRTWVPLPWLVVAVVPLVSIVAVIGVMHADARGVIGVMAALIVGALALAVRSRGELLPPRVAHPHGYAFGAAVAAVGIPGGILLSAVRVPPPLFAAIFGAAVAATLIIAARRSMLRAPTLGRVAVGGYLTMFALTLVTHLARHNATGALTNVAFIGAMLVVAWRVRVPRGTPPGTILPPAGYPHGAPRIFLTPGPFPSREGE